MDDKKEFVEQLIEKLDECMEEMTDWDDDNAFEAALLLAENLRQELLEISKNLI